MEEKCRMCIDMQNPGNGRLEIRLDEKSASPVAVISTTEQISAEFDCIAGVHPLYIRFFGQKKESKCLSISFL